MILKVIPVIPKRSNPAENEESKCKGSQTLQYPNAMSNDKRLSMQLVFRVDFSAVIKKQTTDADTHKLTSVTGRTVFLLHLHLSSSAIVLRKWRLINTFLQKTQLPTQMVFIKWLRFEEHHSIIRSCSSRRRPIGRRVRA